MRAVVCVIGGVFASLAAVAAFVGSCQAAAMLGGIAAVMLIGLAVERWRYKRLTAGLPGPEWQRTEERFVDPETGKLVTVYFHPATGERRYIAG